MSVSFYQLGYNKLSQIIFEWQDGERASLLSLFILVEVMLHWAWCLMVWMNKEKMPLYMDMEMFTPLWLCITLVALFYVWLVEYFYRIKNQPMKLLFYQWLLVIVYGIYTVTLTLIMGYSSLIAGVSLVGGTMLAMLLINRRIVWYTFLVYVVLILFLTVLPYFGGHLPKFRQLPIQSFSSDNSLSVLHSGNQAAIMPIQPPQVGRLNAVVMIPMSDANSTAIQRDNALFWRMTYFYFTLPKAIIIVYMFQTLLSIIDSNKRKIQYHADHDVLTGIKNRRCILNWIHQSIFYDSDEGNLIRERDYSVILIDLDSFKSVNDNYGHQAGDKVLQEVAEILVNAFSRRHMVSRYGGEEFLIALPHTSHQEAIDIAEQLREDIQAHGVNIGEQSPIYLTASFGVASILQDELWVLQQNYRSLLAEDKVKLLNETQLTEHIIENLIDLADNALYEAKRTGRNKVVSANNLVAVGKVRKPNLIF